MFLQQMKQEQYLLVYHKVSQLALLRQLEVTKQSYLTLYQKVLIRVKPSQ